MSRNNQPSINPEPSILRLMVGGAGGCILAFGAGHDVLLWLRVGCLVRASDVAEGGVWCSVRGWEGACGVETFSPSVSTMMCFFNSPCLALSLSPSPSLSLLLSLPPSPSPCLALCLCLSLSLPPCLPLSLSLPLSRVGRLVRASDVAGGGVWCRVRGWEGACGVE